jgi:PhoH-like ATPase
MAQRKNGHRNPSQSHRGKGNNKGKSGNGSVTPSRQRSKKPSIPTHLREVSKKTGELVTYVLDTNVIMHHANAIYTFDEHEVVMCAQVWHELDEGKSRRDTETAVNIRRTVKSLAGLVRGRSEAELTGGLVLEPPEEMRNGKPHTGKIIWEFSESDFEALSNDSLRLNPDQPDHHILASCLKLQKNGKKVVLVTNDNNFAVIAGLAGVTAEPYYNDVIEYLPASEEDVITGFHALPQEVWSNIAPTTSRHVDENGVTEYEIDHEFFRNVRRNEFVTVENEGLHLRLTKKRSATNVTVRTLHNFSAHDFFDIMPRNPEQEFGRELLMDDTIPSVTLAGLAGSGKTFLALAAALAQKHKYQRIVITRSPQGSDEEIGFLPGTEEEKMEPWMGGAMDNLEELICSEGFEKQERSMTIDYALNNFNIKFMSMNLMKGRSFRNTYVIVDEAQDLNPKTSKMITTRIGPGSKVVFLGNVKQIDNNQVGEHTNGLSVMIRKAANTSLAGHVTLQKGERSPLATWAEENL